MSTITLKQLSKDIHDFVAFKKSLGFKYERNVFSLRSFERFAKTHAKGNKVVWESTLAMWLARYPNLNRKTVSVDFGTIEQLCLFRQRRQPNCFVPDRNLLPRNVQTRFLPYVFSVDQIHFLLDAAQQYQSRSISESTLYHFLLTLYCTGLRPGECARLTAKDADLVTGVFTIHESKGKTRLVPFGEDLATKLCSYRKENESIALDNISLWVRRDGTPVPVATMLKTVSQLFRRSGLKPSRGRKGPRPYDVRHTYAVHRLTRWYEQGIDIHAHLPWLSAYMGHDNVLGTEVYLHATPELLQIASDRFARYVQPEGIAR